MIAYLRAAYLRLDARSLGLFRIAMGFALLLDLWNRWLDVRAFYSNDGLLANHAHLNILLRGDSKERVWSLLHAFSTPGENRVALALCFLVYTLFLLGRHTRIFHVLSLVALISLTGRNVFAANPSNSIAILLLAATAFLPCGSRFSWDSLKKSFRIDEKNAAQLNQRELFSAQTIRRERAPGYSPTSLAALAVLLQIAIVLIAVWFQQTGPTWQNSTALHYSLWAERWVSGIGVWVRLAPPGLLKGWSMFLRMVPIFVPVLLFIPIVRPARSVAAVLLFLYGLTYALLFSLGLWGFSLMAAAFLVIPEQSWNAYQRRFKKNRAITVIYDADCGICLWLTRLLKRLDLKTHLTFQGNDQLTEPLSLTEAGGAPYRAPSDGEEPPRFLHRRIGLEGAVEAVPLPPVITDDLVTGTVVAVNEKGEVSTEGAAVAQILRSLPLGAFLSLPFRIPFTAPLWNRLYRLVPPRRFAISEALGLGVCGIPKIAAPNVSPDETNEVPPATRTMRFITGAFREVFALLLLATSTSQTAKANPWPKFLTIPSHRVFEAVSGWSQMRSKYDLFANPKPEEGVLIVDAVTRDGRSVDPLTGVAPNFETPTFRHGYLMATYCEHVRKKEPKDLEKPFRDYLIKGASQWVTEPIDNQIVGLDVYYLRYESPEPGGRTAKPVAREKVMTHAKGGTSKTNVPLMDSAPKR